MSSGLSYGEKLLLRTIYRFSKPRKFQYGLNYKYIPKALQKHVNSLFDKRLIFYKTKYGNKYWLPTIYGRNVVETEFKLDVPKIKSHALVGTRPINLDEDKVRAPRGVIGIELSDIEAGRKCERCGKGTIKVGSVGERTHDEDAEIMWWEGYCSNCGQAYQVFND